MEETMCNRKETPSGCWEVWRQDDNGNTFVIETNLAKEKAEDLAARMTARGHKQMYWAQQCGKEKPTHK
jgi:hypothetical protein